MLLRIAVIFFVPNGLFLSLKRRVLRVSIWRLGKTAKSLFGSSQAGSTQAG
jgi:hypothetical protein